MGGSSVPSSTTQTTMLDPTRQAALKKSMGYFDKWADTYKGPTYKGPLTAGRTSDWYAAQNMAHKMANRFSEGGITSVRRFDDGGLTLGSVVGPPSATSDQSYGPVPFAMTNDQVPTGYNNTYAFDNPNLAYAASPSSPTYDQVTVTDKPQAPFVPTNDWGEPYQPAVANPNAQSLNPYTTMDATGWTAEPPAPTPKTDAQLTGTNWTSADIDSGEITPAELNRLRDLNTIASKTNAQALNPYDTMDATGLNPYDTKVNPAVTYTYAPSSQQQLEDKAVNAGYQGDYTDTAAMDSFIDANNQSKVNVAGTGLDALKDKVDVADTGAGLDALKDKVNVADTDAEKTDAEKVLTDQAAKDTELQKAITDANLTPANVTPTVTSTNMGSPYLLGQALTLGGAGSAFRLGSDVTPKQIYNSYNTPDKFTPDTWNKAAMDTYMSPYTQGVVDIALREAERQRGIERLRENTAATQSGAFGGYRQGVVEAEGERNYNQSRNDITTKGYQNAYTDAVAQFAADRAAKQAAYTANQQALQAAATGDISAGQYNQANKFQAFTNQLNALNQGVNNVQNLGALETAYQTAMGNAGAALNSTDAGARADQQAQYDALMKVLNEIGNVDLVKFQNLVAGAGVGSGNNSNTQVKVSA